MVAAIEKENAWKTLQEIGCVVAHFHKLEVAVSVSI